MALRVARGLFRLWLVVSVLWMGGVGVATWGTFPEDYVPPSDRRGANSKTPPEFDPSKPYVVLPDAPKGVSPSQAPQAPEFDPDEYLAFKAGEERRSAIWHASLLAFLPPAFLLALGSALVWAFKGFR
jgi:hypothetical protein